MVLKNKTPMRVTLFFTGTASLSQFLTHHRQANLLQPGSKPVSPHRGGAGGGIAVFPTPYRLDAGPEQALSKNEGFGTETESRETATDPSGKGKHRVYHQAVTSSRSSLASTPAPSNESLSTMRDDASGIDRGSGVRGCGGDTGEKEGAGDVPAVQREHVLSPRSRENLADKRFVSQRRAHVVTLGAPPHNSPTRTDTAGADIITLRLLRWGGPDCTGVIRWLPPWQTATCFSRVCGCKLSRVGPGRP